MTILCCESLQQSTDPVAGFRSGKKRIREKSEHGERGRTGRRVW